MRQADHDTAEPARPSAAQDWARALTATASIARDPGRTLPDLVDALALNHGARPALIGESTGLSYDELASRSRRYARWALAQGLGRGDRIALLMGNDPDYLAIWLGLGRIGVVTALINTSLVGGSLAHALRVSEARHVIVQAALRERLGAPDGVAVWTHGSADGEACIEADMSRRSDAPLRPDEGVRPTIADTALLVFTSGTTGFPKAALVSHRRILEWSLWFAGLADVTSDDRMYLCLPMSHSVGGIVAPGALLVRGGSVVIRSRFSLSRFWPDVTASGATLFQYIGELCRLLAEAPPHPDEARHRLRLCVGNGLAPAPWRAFAARFTGLRILEFYASTEGNLSLYNCEGEVGAIGRVPPLLAGRFPFAIVRCDPETGTLLRGTDGFCIPCAWDEPGEALGLIGSGEGDAGRPFEGYTDPAATSAKVAHDVRTPGDRWFRTGDLMRRDRRGFVRFVERIGDTFRWKGENVSCAEVTETLLAIPGVRAAAVFGVDVPGHEGRAGMAALAVDPDFDAAGFNRSLRVSLPSYACPVFLRLADSLPLTSTFKPAVGDLRAVGFAPARCPDPILAWDRQRGAYMRLDPAGYARIAAGDWPF
ncbi:long-chain-acyl-CoA synthetase [Methylobacterium sp. J-070]|uniref:long-chain-acyl-CoA synthetase n=1 Tax=Methylobacterium sp. J-070 TaxID=2836650 RepID=UPI001FBA1188|nr:long-chain-acyl-CoA synthetase [Methylobacterium sp. J-070]MCJ2052958.1 long-chain-acyl-CoA synthetase [Methylobacterium sp. J-070]